MKKESLAELKLNFYLQTPPENLFFTMCDSIKYFYRFLQKIMLVFILLHSFLAQSQSTTRLDSLKHKLNQATCDSLKIIYELKISREIHRQPHEKEEGYAYAKKAMERALFLKDTILYARTLDNFGLLNRFHQDYEEALDFHIKGFKLVENRKDVKPLYKMIFANNAGVAARYNQQYATAVYYYMKALKIAEKHNDLRNIAIASNGIGNAFSNIPGREKAALQYFKRALEVSKKTENSLGEAMNYLSISNYYIYEKEYEKARNYLDKLLQLNIKRDDLYGLAITYEFFGISYLKEGKNLTKAVAYFENSLERFKALDDNHKQAEILMNLGNSQVKLNNLRRGEEYFRKSLKLAEELKQFELVSLNSKKLSQVLAKEVTINKLYVTISRLMSIKTVLKLPNKMCR
ncbi:tetratricopeptide repeat protein [Mesonia maritima]|uniref:tetratricopeptide repeat protein n=1 Tax=Mesonia maritima TaxID=1793873 RepID=UPI00363379E3